MAAQHRNRGGQVAAPPSFSLLSLNVARQATLGGLAVLLDQLPQLPTVIFLQEVAMAADLLQAAAQRLGFESHVSPSPQDFSRRLVLCTGPPRSRPSQTSLQVLPGLSPSPQSLSFMSTTPQVPTTQRPGITSLGWMWLMPLLPCHLPPCS